ncbi:hypothetical protein Bbelb_025760 [Branchiostoma belcheri]|nr:hypothetical protein Bbelb_025760 [Branchiostoma belcheri]
MRHSPELIRSLMHVVRLAVNHFRSQGNRHHGDMRPNPSTHRAYPFNTTNDPFHPQVRPINDLPVHCVAAGSDTHAAYLLPHTRTCTNTHWTQDSESEWHSFSSSLREDVVASETHSGREKTARLKRRSDLARKNTVRSLTFER